MPNLNWRHYSGPYADEVFVQYRIPSRKGVELEKQILSMYEKIKASISAPNTPEPHILCETVFFRDIKNDIPIFQKARRHAFALMGNAHLMPAITLIEQPPLDLDTSMIVHLIALTPHQGSAVVRNPSSFPNAAGYRLGKYTHLYAGDICGNPGGAYDQAYSMFSKAEEILASEDMTFRNVVRTWIYLREMERDYLEFNRARRDFFRRCQVTLLPASTGIHGSPFSEHADFSLAFCALKSPGQLDASIMTTPMLNEAWMYGSDFSRGLQVVDSNKVALYISGTASVDEKGDTVHEDNFPAQVDRMLLNVESLLASRGGSFRDIHMAVTYLKNAEHTSAFNRIVEQKGLASMPNTVVRAAVCRDNLLCEMEAIAVLPLARE